MYQILSMNAKIILFDDNEALLNLGTYFYKNVDNAFVKKIESLDCPYEIINYCNDCKKTKGVVELEKQPIPKYDIEIDFRNKIDINMAIEIMNNR